MRFVFGLLSLLVSLWVVWQLSATQLRALGKPAAAPTAATDGATGAAPGISPRHQPEQVRRTVEGLMQQARPMPQDEP